MMSTLSRLTVLLLVAAVSGCGWGRPKARPTVPEPYEPLPVRAGWSADALLPVDHADRALQFDLVLAKLVEDQPDYQVKYTEHTWGRPGSMIGGISRRYEVVLPDYARRFVDQREPYHHINALVYHKLFEPATSYEAAILYLAKPYVYNLPPAERVQPLMDQDKAQWIAQYDGYARNMISYESFHPVDSYREVFFALLPEEKRDALSGIIPPRRSFEGERAHYHEYSIGRGTPLFGLDASTPLYVLTRRFVDGEPGGEALFAEPFTPNLQLVWSFFLLNSTDVDGLQNTQKFFEYAQSFEQDAFATWAAALLVTRGYRYNSQAGTYTLNAIGRACVQYLQAHAKDNADAQRVLAHVLANASQAP